MEIRCAGCSGKQAALCADNFNAARDNVSEGVERTLAGGWNQFTVQPDGTILETPLAGTSKEAMYGQSVLRLHLINSLETGQSEIGCTFSRELIEQKLSME